MEVETTKNRVQVRTARAHCFEIPRSTWSRWHQKQQLEPVSLGTKGQRQLWWYRGDYYWDDDNLRSQDVALLVRDRKARQRRKLARLREQYADDGEKEPDFWAALVSLSALAFGSLALVVLVAGTIALLVATGGAGIALLTHGSNSAFDVFVTVTSFPWVMAWKAAELIMMGIGAFLLFGAAVKFLEWFFPKRRL